MHSKVKIIFLVIAIYSQAYSQIKPVSPQKDAVLHKTDITFRWDEPSAMDYSFDFMLATDSNFTNVVNSQTLAAKELLLTLNEGESYFWQLRINGQSEWSDTFAFKTINPKNLDSLLMWFNADYIEGYNDNDSIGIWTDSSANGFDLLQTNEIKKPRIKLNRDSINNHNWVNFDGVDDFLKINGLNDYEQPINYFFIIRPRVVDKDFFDGGEFLEQFGRFSLNKLYSFADLYLVGNQIIEPNFFYNFNLEFNSPNSKSFINNLLDAEGDNGYSTMSGLTLGGLASGGNNSKIDIAEVIVINDSINDSLRTSIHNYLYHKYAPPVSLGYNIRIEYGFCDTILDAGSRFTNYLWSTGDTTQSISIASPGMYAVTVSDVFGIESKDSVYVYYPSVNNLADSTFCFGDTILWNTGLNHTYTFEWNNASSDSLLDIFSEGEYFVKITDSFGCSYQSDTAQITIDYYPSTVSLGEDDTICAGQSIALVSGADETETYLWSNDSTNSQIVINNSGAYSITTTNDYGCIATDTINLMIRGYAPIPGFYTEDQCLNDITSFIDTSLSTDLSNIVEWYWDFGNGNTSDLQHPEFTFSDTGTHVVNLRIVTDSLCENSFNQNVRIYSNPVALFSNNALCQGYLVDFINESSSNMGAINYNRWDFGNNDTSLSASVQRTFDTEGTYDIQLKVRTTDNCEDILDTSIVIKPSPKAEFSYTPACVGHGVTFIDESEYTGIFNVSSWEWKTSTGEISEDESAIFTFNQSEMIEVQLKAGSVNGCVDSISKSIWIYDNPIANFIVDTLCAYNDIIIENTSTDAQSTINEYYWWIDGQLISTDLTPEFTAQDSGNYTVELKVVSSSFCYNTKTEVAVARPLPNSDFTVSEDYTTPNQNIVFTADSINSELDYFYQFGDASEGFTSIENKSYSSKGVYQSQLIVTNPWQCSDSTQREITVVHPLMNLSLSELEIVENNGKYAIQLRLANVGNLAIYGVTFRIEVDEQMVFEEKSEQVLMLGETFLVELSTQLLNKPEYICISGLPNGIFTDIDLNNNSECLKLYEDSDIIKIYPNPVGETLNLLFYSDKNESRNFQIINSLGQKIINNTIELKKGLHKYSISTKHLSAGHYVLKFDLSTKKFIKE